MAQGVVRQRDEEEGWGVLDSPETPGGCWAHFSASTGDYGSLEPGVQVVFEFERGEQDGFQFRATSVRPT